MHTTPAIINAIKRYSGPIQPRITNAAQVSSSVAIVIPEIGFDEEPISPVIRELTVTNRNPKSTIKTAPTTRPTSEVGIRLEPAITPTKASEPNSTTDIGRSRSVRCLALPGSPTRLAVPA